jgi:hypothetical protein
MRYPASEKLEIIRTVEISPLPVRRTLAQIGIPITLSSCGWRLRRDFFRMSYITLIRHCPWHV